MDWSWAIEGITEEMPRSTGPECANSISTKRKVVESIFVIAGFILALKWAIQRLPPISTMTSSSQQTYGASQNHHQYQQNQHNSPYPSLAQSTAADATPMGKQLLLVAMTFVFGMEMGFKFATKTVIFVLNPCHITTIIQIYLLASKPSKTSTALFRIQMNYMNGPLLAFIFPEAESRILPMEATAYWIQHGLMFIIPIYLLRLGGAYQMENIFDFKWNIISYALLMIYHFVVLQIMSVISNVNLNHMLCAAESDPFDGSNFRLFAVLHQAMLCPILCKLISIIFTNTKQIQVDIKIIKNSQQMFYKEYDNQSIATSNSSVSATSTSASRIDDKIMTTKID